MSTLNAADVAWMLTATCLVLLMTAPGLVLFYGGMVRRGNVLFSMMQSLSALCLATIVWVGVGYSLAFSPGGTLTGGLSNIMLAGISKDSMRGNIPELLFMMFQLSFAVVTAAVICGAFVERMRYPALLLFLAGWLIVVYAPVAHWIWGGGFLQQWGVQDFAGGAVVELNSGVAALTAAVVLGPRRGHLKELMRPHDLGTSAAGAGMLWVGWLGFNGGSALAADSTAALAIANTQIAGAAGAFGWLLLEWWQHRRPTLLGLISGAVAGLVAITPAAGLVSPGSAMALGLAGGVVCFFACTSLKRRLGFDDELDVFGIHGVGGIVGVLGVGVLASTSWGGVGGLLEGNARLAGLQLLACLIVACWSAAASYVILRVIDLTIGLSVSREEQDEELDLERLNETAA